MLKKMALLIIAASFLFIVTVPIHSHDIEPQVQHGGA
ncbi:hypothetical protein PPOLYM_03430 [Paenibacillus polymyxa]|nr:hypothetical protein PPOLYM_03430 [Paenibacillus polymyxa]